MELWECIHYKQFCDREPFCDKLNSLETCGENCHKKYTLGEWREFLKTIPAKVGVDE